MSPEILKACQPIICDVDSNPSEDKFPVWAQFLTGILVAVLIFGIFLLKKMATHTCTAVFGFVLGGSMVPRPRFEDVDLEAANENMEMESQPSAPPSYEVAVQNSPV